MWNFDQFVYLVFYCFIDCVLPEGSDFFFSFLFLRRSQNVTKNHTPTYTHVFKIFFYKINTLLVDSAIR